IVEVNGEATKGLSLVEAAQKMRGKLGSPVRLGIMREGFEKPKEFSIVRGTVKLKSVKYTDLEDGFGYLRVTSFVEKTADDMERLLKEHEKKHKDIKGLVIDLRNNPGGLLDQAVRLSDAFLDSGTIVSTVGRNQKEKEVLYAKKEGTRAGFPIVVLINEYSASASEILAGALQDNKRAVIVGKRSFGKGSVQSVVKLGDGSGLKLTVARYFTPSGRSIQAEGIQPDVVLEEVNPELYEKSVVKRKVRREKDIRGHLAGESEKSGPYEDEDDGPSEKPAPTAAEKAKLEKNQSPKDALLKGDFQVAQAFNYLKTWKMFKAVQ
ncbi:MAG: S41 family peptidase, partial [Bdellovibrionales bacterium]|nr:S41 family peptidase [Bdellovibrionales bacterium]